MRGSVVLLEKIAPAADDRPRLPSQIATPAFLMCPPFTVSNEEPNNVYMSPSDRPYNWPLAMRQWMTLYQRLAREALVFLLPSGNDGLQDLPFVSNLAAGLPHKPDTVLVSRFTSPPRWGEKDVGARFFAEMGYSADVSPYPWEGEAELKHVRGNTYIGGVGQRSTRAAYDWMRAAHGMNIVEVHLGDPKLYHLDCSVFLLDRNTALVATSALEPDDVAELEKIVGIVDVPKANVYDGWTNSLRLGDKVLNSPRDAASARALERLLAMHNLDLETVNLSEFMKSGADLSCLVMHLNDRGRRRRLA